VQVALARGGSNPLTLTFRSVDRNLVAGYVWDVVAKAPVGSNPITPISIRWLFYSESIRRNC
jgi:hypothetical protein